MSAFDSAPPSFTASEINQILKDHYGLAGTQTALESERDQNVAIDTGDTKYVLKIANAAEDIAFLDLQSRAMAHLADNHFPYAPAQIENQNGANIFSVEKQGQHHAIRLISFINGPLLSTQVPTLETLENLGRAIGQLSASLQGFSHQAAERSDFEWNLDNVLSLKPLCADIVDQNNRKRIEALFERYEQVVAPKLTNLRNAVLYQDANDNNIIVDANNNTKIIGVFDFGDMCFGRQVNELAVCMAYALLGQKDIYSASQALVRGYASAFALTEPELDVLFDLARMRLVSSVCMSSRQAKKYPNNEYLTISQQSAFELLERLESVDVGFMTALFRNAAGFEAIKGGNSVSAFLKSKRNKLAPMFLPDFKYQRRFVIPADGSDPSVPDLSAQEFDAWFNAKRTQLDTRYGIGRYGEDRTVYQSAAFASPASPERRTMHMGLDVFVDANEPLYAPIDGTVFTIHNNAFHLDYGPTLILRHETDNGAPFFSLYGHLSPSIFELHKVGDKIEAGQLIGHIGDWDVNGGWSPHLHFQIMTDMFVHTENFYGVGHKSLWHVWQQICIDPDLMLGQAPETYLIDNAGPDELMERRDKLLGPSLSVSYDKKLKIVRGEGVHLFDQTGRAYLDCVNNITHIGHCHPHLVEAISKQAAILNTNTRYLNELVLDYAERITSKLPSSLSVAFFVNSGTEANELALRIARHATGQKNTVVLDWAYHGNSQGAVDISPYKFKRKGGFPQPDFVEIAEFPDPYRGPHKGYSENSGKAYAQSVADCVENIKAKTGNGAATFIAESISGVGGQIAYPKGYLQAAHAAIRAQGGICVADEVQCGFGRVGDHFWGFELQDVVPDIVVMGKPIGNGHPLAAVVTTKELAANFANGMEYFNSFGGNPVSMAVGLAVMDVIENENMQSHAKELGAYILNRWETLKDKYDFVGDVRGHGLFLGIELVKNRNTLEPATDLAGKIVNEMRDRAILLSTDGPLENVLKFKPPMVFSRENADFLCDTLDAVFADFA
ncbi:aminotransferase class III-fold pyridoxal phosphate-dependent enzyme [Maritalea sp.]|jgi:4-aminobutyrate aminotransferase-like enzyme/Ser/Thr protein kinase RdoA (MazF antagonist)|uniref:aminotransferase class III-fold pyridoxal phosphate-dependent enzyme n=1 Tax=Maritalea sp. TaxID=2003361 RepID=UPI0039E2291F